jgi:hypothetical protein
MSEGSVDSSAVRAGITGGLSTVPKPFPKEFRRDVIAVVRQADLLLAHRA